jgi:D-proline reductase (dithiol) PrdB
MTLERERREPIAYMARTRAYYSALGYPPYRWAHHETTPFTRPRVAISGARLVLITTAAPFDPDHGDQGPGAPYNARAKFYAVYERPLRPAPDLRIAHVAYDRVHSHARDPNTWLPIPALEAAAEAGRIGDLAAHLIGLPTDRSQRSTRERDAPAVLEACRRLAADVALLVPNCPVCHQSVALVARHLEANGIATVVLGAARDIVEHCRVPRFVFSDFPLGNSAGRPFDRDSQRATLAAALALYDAPDAPTTWQSPQRWASDDRWKDDYLDPRGLSAEVLAERRAEFDADKAIARTRAVPSSVSSAGK